MDILEAKLMVFDAIDAWSKLRLSIPAGERPLELFDEVEKIDPGDIFTEGVDCTEWPDVTWIEDAVV